MYVVIMTLPVRVKATINGYFYPGVESLLPIKPPSLQRQAPQA